MLDSVSSLLNSASKIFFIMIGGTICVAFLWAVFTGKITLDQDKFWLVVASATTYYFSYKPADPKPPAVNVPPEAVK